MIVSLISAKSSTSFSHGAKKRINECSPGQLGGTVLRW